MAETLLSVPELLAELGGVARSTFNRWRALGSAPRPIKLPNGELRFRRSVVDEWLASREEPAA